MYNNGFEAINDHLRSAHYNKELQRWMQQMVKSLMHDLCIPLVDDARAIFNASHWINAKAESLSKTSSNKHNECTINEKVHAPVLHP